MWEANVVGFLLIEGVSPTPRDLTGLLGGSERELTKLIDELGSKNVYSVTGGPMPGDIAALVPAGMPAGVMLSRRMLRDKAKADKDRENGKGGGNPQIVGPDNPGVNPPPNPQKPDSLNPSSSIETEAAREAQRAGSARLARSAGGQAMDSLMANLATKKRVK
jgi:hypothetical protein